MKLWLLRFKTLALESFGSQAHFGVIAIVGLLLLVTTWLLTLLVVLLFITTIVGCLLVVRAALIHKGQRIMSVDGREK